MKQHTPFQIDRNIRECSPLEDLDPNHLRISCDRLRLRHASVPALGQLPCSVVCAMVQQEPANDAIKHRTFHKLHESGLLQITA